MQRLKKNLSNFSRKIKQLIKEPYEIIIEEYESNIIEIKIKKNFGKTFYWIRNYKSFNFRIMNLYDKRKFKMDKLTDIINHMKR
jgi:hypothetical protein